MCPPMVEFFTLLLKLFKHYRYKIYIDCRTNEAVKSRDLEVIQVSDSLDIQQWEMKLLITILGGRQNGLYAIQRTYFHEIKKLRRNIYHI